MRFCKLYDRVSQKIRQDETSSCRGMSRKWNTNRSFIEMFSMYILPCEYAWWHYVCDSVLTVSLPTHYIHDKIWLRTLLISATIVFIMWHTRELAVFKGIFFFWKPANYIAHFLKTLQVETIKPLKYLLPHLLKIISSDNHRLESQWEGMWRNHT